MRINLTNISAWKEAISDTVIGTIINFPLNLLTIWLIFEWQLSVVESSIFLWTVFTTIAVLRKYCLRIYFIKQNKE